MLLSIDTSVAAYPYPPDAFLSFERSLAPLNQYAQTPVTILNPSAADADTREHMFEWRRRSQIELCNIPWTAASVLIYRVEITDEVDSQGDEIWRLQVIAGERKHDPLAGLLTLPGGKSTTLTQEDLYRIINETLRQTSFFTYHRDLAIEALLATLQTSVNGTNFIEPVHLTAQRELLEETGIHIPFIQLVKSPLCVYFYEKHTLLLFVIRSSGDDLSVLEPMQTESDLADPRWVDALYFIPRTGEIWLNYTIIEHLVPALAQMVNYLIGYFDTSLPHHYFNL